MCLLMQYCSNGDLATRIKKQGNQPFGIVKIVKWFEQLGQAIKYLHGRNVIHRDIKPQNVMLDNADNALLADFGVANYIESTGRTMTAGKGTHGYMAPETYEEGYSATANVFTVDIFSLGATLFEVSNLKKAYTGSVQQICMKLVKKAGPEEFAEHCPQQIRQLLLKCLTLDEKNRPDIQKVIADLNEVQQDRDFIISRLTVKLADGEAQTAELVDRLETEKQKNAKKMADLEKQLQQRTNDHEAEKNETKKQFQELYAKTAELAAKITDGEEKAAQLASQLTCAEFKNTELEAKLQQQTDSLEIEKKNISKLNADIVQLKAKVLSGISFGCGYNGSSRELGVSGGNQKKPVKSDFGVVQFVNADYDTCTITPLGVLFINGKEMTMSERVKCATTYSGSNYAIDVNGRLLTWGKNSDGQLGDSNTDEQTTPKVIDALENVRQVSVYGSRVACTTTDDSVYVWGNCDAFGLGEKVTTPTKLDQRATHVEVGKGHAMLISNGEVLSRGANSCGQLGVGDNQSCDKWTKVNLPSGEQVRQIQCGQYCSAILTNRSVYVTGQYLNGGKDDSVNVPTQIKLDNISAISLKSRHILALDTKGAVFSWGHNSDDGRCGVGSDAEQIKKPTRVAIPEHYAVTQISAGMWHSMFKCESK